MVELLPRSARASHLGNYEPLMELASGGMATVYVARHVGAAGFERLVVIKRVHPHLLKNREFHDMFRDEARVSSTIRHPNVVPVVDVIETDHELLLVLEYVEGMSLSALGTAAAAAGSPLSPPVVSRILVDTLAGLHAAHEAVDLRGNKIELIHRDVSPQNILVGQDGTSRLIDFGIAKAASRINVTHSGVVKGKLRYMSPEQVHQKPLDRRADVFAAGVVLYEALTGRRPFAGEDDGDLVLGILIGEIEPPSLLVPALSREVDAVVEKALARDREERYPTAAAMQEALEEALPPAPAREVTAAIEALGGAGLAAQREALRAAIESAAEETPALPGAPAPPPPLGTVPDPPGPPRSGRRDALLGAIAASLLIAVGFLALRGRRSDGGPPPPAAPAASASVAIEPERAPAGSVELPTASSMATASASTTRPPRRFDHPRATPNPDLHRRNPYGDP